tara:strand:+ start:305 stop:541 length:237 start_codon:yes stop_codon:yes gene_type:complete
MIANYLDWIVDHDAPEWERVWQVLEDRFGCRRCCDEYTGEVWQYMGSSKTHHDFRHRNYNGIGRKCIKIDRKTFNIEE